MKAEERMAEYSVAAVPVAPATWKTVPLGEVLEDIVGGGTPSRSNPAYWEGNIPWLTVKDMRSRRPQDSIDHISEDAVRGSATNLIPADTVIIATRIGLGKVIRVPYDATINQDLKALITKPIVDKGYLEYWIVSIANHLDSIGSGTTVKGIRLEQLRSIPFPLAPLDQQKRIVAEIEKQFSRLDEAVANLKRVKANLKRYKAAVLKAAVEGKLTEAWRRQHPETRPSSELLQRTEAPPRPNRYSTRSMDVIPGHAALAVGNPGTALPEGWSWSALVDIARMESGHTPSRSHPEWWEGDVPWIGIADAREHHGKLIADTVQHTNDAGLANSAARLLPAGTVCISRTASVGYVVVMARPMATSQDFVNWTPTQAVTSDWLRVVFLADREALIRFGKGSVHKTIYFPEWLSVHIAVPPIAEQNRIVSEVERLLSLADDAEVQVSGNLQRAERLRQAVLAKAFKGTRSPSSMEAVA
jgi:type I restriction enzyme S subunit